MKTRSTLSLSLSIYDTKVEEITKFTRTNWDDGIINKSKKIEEATKNNTTTTTITHVTVAPCHAYLSLS